MCLWAVLISNGTVQRNFPLTAKKILVKGQMNFTIVAMQHNQYVNEWHYIPSVFGKP